MARKRDFRAEYARRIALAKSRARSLGIKFSRAQARGHAAKGEVPISIFKRNEVIRRQRQATEKRLEKAFRLIRGGASVTSAAKSAGMSRGTLRRVGVERGVLVPVEATRGPRFAITSKTVDILTSSGRVHDNVPLDRRALSTMGRYWNAVDEAISTGSSEPLKGFKGTRVKGLDGREYTLATNLKTILRVKEQDPRWTDDVTAANRRKFVYSL